MNQRTSEVRASNPETPSPDATGALPAAFVVAVFPLAVGLATVALLVGLAFGWTPLWPDPRLNVAELATLRDVAGVVREHRLGADMNEVYPIRQGLLPNKKSSATPLEAAIYCRERWFVQIVIDLGARIGDWNRSKLTCLARAVQAPDIEALVSEGRMIECPQPSEK